MSEDNWADKSTLACGTCVYFVEKGPSPAGDGLFLGRCRYNPPVVVSGWPAVYASDWCGQHKLATIVIPMPKKLYDDSGLVNQSGDVTGTITGLHERRKK